MVNITLGPDRLAGLNAFNISQLLQTTNYLMCMVMGCTCLWEGGKGFLLLMPLNRAVDKTFNVFSHDEVWAEHRTHLLLNDEQMRYVLCYNIVF